MTLNMNMNMNGAWRLVSGHAKITRFSPRTSVPHTRWHAAGAGESVRYMYLRAPLPIVVYRQLDGLSGSWAVADSSSGFKVASYDHTTLSIAHINERYPWQGSRVRRN